MTVNSGLIPMKTLPLLALFCLASASLLAASTDQPPEGLSKSDWASIREAHSAWKHRLMPMEGKDGHWQAWNPGQRWTTNFDGRGFLAQPEDGEWRWGLELRSYGYGTRQRFLSSKPEVTAEAARLSYRWDKALQEWWVNDQRGLEHGFTVGERPTSGTEAAELVFVLGTRGTLRPQVSADAHGVVFQDAAGAAVLTYTGLKVWDADGKVLPSRFEAAGENAVKLLVNESSARYPLTIDPIAQQAYVKASNTGGSDEFGKSVDISGDTVVVGAWNEDGTGIGVNPVDNNSGNNRGAAYVFVRNGTTWTQQAYLKATSGTSVWLGICVAVDGNTVAVGSLNNGGAVEIYTRSGTTWTSQARVTASNSGGNDNFGASIDLSGDYLVVGAYYEDSSSTGINSTSNELANNAGAAYVFLRDGTTWTQQAYIKASNAGAGDMFGVSVAISDSTIVVGAAYEDTGGSDAGAAYVFTRSGTTWTQQAFLTGVNTGANDLFGWTVSISGETIVVGAQNEDGSGTGVNPLSNESATNSGAAYVFIRSGTSWGQQAYLKASNTGANDNFGGDVAIDADTIVVGAINEKGSGSGINPASNESIGSAGAGYIFVRINGFWSQQAYVKSSNPGLGDFMGSSVSISGRTAVISANMEDGSGVGINPTDNNSAADSGAVYIFHGVGPDPADIAVSGNSSNIADGDTTPTTADHTDFGSVAVAGSANVTRTFTISNAGATDMNLTSLVIGGTNASEFVLTTAASTPVIPGGSTSFNVRFNPRFGGLRTATITIGSDDEDENPFEFSIQGTGLNTTPVAVADSFVTPPDVGRVLLASSFLANDTDEDDDTVTLISVQDAVNGSVRLLGGLVLFTPTAGFSGNAAFTYTASDGLGGTATGNVTVTVSTTTPISMNGGMLLFTNTTTVQNPVTVTGDSQIDTTGTVTFSSGINGSGQIEKTGTGTLVLNAASTFSGGFTATAGEVGIGHDAALGTGTVTLGGAAINALGGLRVLGNEVVLNANTTIKGEGLGLTGSVSVNGSRVLDTQGTLDITGPVQGTAALVKMGAGFLILGGNNTFTGGITAAEGTLGLASSTAAGSGLLTLAGADLFVLDDEQTLSNPVVLSADTTITGENMTLTGPVRVLGEQTLTLESWLQISGLLRGGNAQAELIKDGGGELVLGPASKVEVPIEVEDGAVNPLGIVTVPIAVRNPGIPVPSTRPGQHISQAIVQGRPAMSFQEPIFGDLLYQVAKDASGTAFEPVVSVDSGQNVGQFTSLCVVNGNPAIAYSDEENRDLKYVRALNALGTAWGRPVTVMSEGKVGTYASLAIVAGRPAIAFYDSANRDLLYVRASDASGTRWPQAQRLYTQGNVGKFASMKVVYGKPVIAFYDATNGDLNLMMADDAIGDEWPTFFYGVQQIGNVGQHASLALVNGEAAISYYDATFNKYDKTQRNQDLCYIQMTQSDMMRWGTPRVVDNSSPMLGGFNSLNVINGRPAISYRNGSKRTLNYAWAADSDGNTWPTNQRMTIAPIGEAGAATSLQFVNGMPAIAYYDSIAYTRGFMRFNPVIAPGPSDTPLVRIQGHTLAQQKYPWQYETFKAKKPVVKGKNTKGKSDATTPTVVGGFKDGTPTAFGEGMQGTALHSIGASPGFVEEANNLVWESGFTMEWQINDAAGIAGLNWDCTKVGGQLQIIATASAPISFDIISLQENNEEGQVPHFNPYVAHTWTVASAGSIAGFNAAAFPINTQRFANETHGGTFSLAQSGGNLNLVFTPAVTTSPDITVIHGGTPLISGGAMVNVGSIPPAGVVTRTFTVRNDGPVPLEAIEIGGADPLVGGTKVDLAFDVPETSTLAPGASLSFTVTITNGLASADEFASSFEIHSNDGDESVFVVTLSGNGLAALPEPEITVKLEPSAVNLTSGGPTPVNFGTVSTGMNVTRTLTVSNTGTADLNNIDFLIDGSRSIDFRVLNAVADSLEAGASLQMTVEFEPSTSGVCAALLRLRSNDADEGIFDIALTGTANAAAEIAVETTAASLVSDDASPVTFGTVSVNAKQDIAFNVSNLGLLDLTGLAISFAGADATHFSIQTPLSGSTLAPGNGDSLVIRFAPQSTGTKTAQLRIVSSDVDESPFIINLSGEGVISPEIEVEKAGQSLAINDLIDFGSVSPGSSTSVTFTIRNLGSANLTGLVLSKSGEAAGDFALGALSTAPPLAGPTGSTTFIITFSPSSGGQRRASLQIASNDTDEGAFTLTLSGEGAVAPSDILLSETTLPENRGTNAVVGTLSASDANTSSAMTFTLVSGAGSSDNALFTISDSTLTLTPDTDFEVKNAYAIRVRATDSSGLFIEKPFTISISNVNEAPGFLLGPDQDIIPGTSAPQIVGQWAQAIHDGDNTVVQALNFEVVGNTNPGLFSTQPAVTVDGALSYTPVGTVGEAVITLALTDDASIDGNPWSKNGNFTIRVYGTPPPSVMGTSPSSGSTLGGTNVTISGANFTGATGVTIGGIAATSVDVVSDISITCVTPAGAAGSASVLVTTPGGTNAENALFTYVTPNTAPSFALPAGVTSPAGTTWTARESSRSWYSIASSADGTKLAAVDVGGQIYTSTDSGVSWTARESSRQWFSITSSADGSKLAVVAQGGQIYTSTDSGVSWTARESNRQWYSITSSADGTKLAAVVYGGQIYTSTDSGVSWTARESNRNWHTITSSADGTKLAVAVYGGHVYTSADSGVTWTPQGSSRHHLSITSSSDGTKLAVVELGGRIYTSADSGVSWTPRESDRYWSTITSSADGNTLIAVVPGGQIYLSNDSGMTWTPRESDRNWWCSAASADGSKLAVGILGGQIYTSVGISAPYSLSAITGSGLQTTPGFATAISPGLAAEAGQSVSFTVANDNQGLFTTQPAISSNGTLTFTPGSTVGVATVTVTAVDDGGTDFGGANTSAAQTFVITLLPPAPVVTVISPAIGSTLGGTEVTITGRDFTGATAVSFGGTNSTSFTVDSSSKITAITPAGTVGSASVLVTTPGGTNAANTLFTYAPPSIFSVSGGGVPISDGDSTPDATDGTDFGSIPFTGLRQPRTFVLANLGTNTLLLTGTPRVVISGANPGDFSVITPPPANLEAGSSARMQIVFQPTALGLRTAVVSVANSGVGTGDFSFQIQGTAYTNPGGLPPGGTFSFSAEGYDVKQGASQVTMLVRRTGGTAATSVRLTTIDGSFAQNRREFDAAQLGVDYLFQDITLNFALNEMSKSVTLSLLPRTGLQPNYRLFALLSEPGPSTYISGSNYGVIRIIAWKRPTAGITTPVASPGLTSGLSPFLATGTAGDTERVGITRVTVSLNGAAAVDATLGAATFMSRAWSLPIQPLQGDNSLEVISYDRNGLASLPVTRSFTFTRRYRLETSLSALGSVSVRATPVSALTSQTATTTVLPYAVLPNTAVTVTATPAAGQVFSHWSSLPAGVDAFTPSFALVMPAADMATTVTPVFVANPFQPPAGQGNTFYGLLRPTSGVATDRSSLAYLTGTLTPTTGVFSGKLSHNGTVVSFVTSFYGNGISVFTVGGVSSQSLTLPNGDRFSLDYSVAGIQAQITRSSAVYSSGMALRIAHTVANPVADALLNVSSMAGGVKTSGYYTLALPAQLQSPPRDLASYPQGDGFATLTLASAGTFTVVGVLADGSAWTAAGGLVRDGQAACFAQLLTPGSRTERGGTFSGTLVFDSIAAGTDVTGDDLIWTRPQVSQVSGSTAAALASQLYTAGWPSGIIVDAVGALYSRASTLQSTLGLSNVGVGASNSVLEFTDGKLVTEVRIAAISINGSSIVKIPTTNGSFTLHATASSGGWSGAFTPNWTSPARTRPSFRGILLQKGTSAGGYGFFLSNRSGDLDPESGRATLGADSLP